MWHYLILFAGTFLLTVLIRKLAVSNSLIDIPNERSSHTAPTPRGGGLAIAVVWYAYITCQYFLHRIDPTFYFALLPGILISATGFIDDIRSLNVRIRLIIQSLAVVSSLVILGGLKKIDLGFYMIENTWLLSIPAFFGILWFTNLYNFIDGIDGYAAAEAIFISLAVFAFFGDLHLLALAVISSGFILLNWQKAKIFMGDVGSTMLGFTFGIYAVFYQNSETTSLIVWIILASVFWFDATLTLIRRYRNKDDIGKPHKKHAFQRIVQAGFSHQKTVVFSMSVNGICLVLAYLGVLKSQLLIPALIINIIILYFLVRMVDSKWSRVQKSENNKTV